MRKIWVDEPARAIFDKNSFLYALAAASDFADVKEDEIKWSSYTKNWDTVIAKIK